MRHKRESETATATPLGSPGAPDGAEAARLVARAGRPAQPSAATIPLPEDAEWKASASLQRAYIPDTYAAPGLEPGTWKDPDPRRRSSRGSGGSE